MISLPPYHNIYLSSSSDSIFLQQNHLCVITHDCINIQAPTVHQPQEVWILHVSTFIIGIDAMSDPNIILVWDFYLVYSPYNRMHNLSCIYWSISPMPSALMKTGPIEQNFFVCRDLVFAIQSDPFFCNCLCIWETLLNVNYIKRLVGTTHS